MKVFQECIFMHNIAELSNSMHWELKRLYVQEIELKRKLGSNGRYWLSFLFSQRKVGVSRMILSMSSKGHRSLNEVDNWFYSCYYGHCFRRKTKLIFLHANCFIKLLHCKNSIKPWRTLIVLRLLVVKQEVWKCMCYYPRLLYLNPMAILKH